MRDRRRSLAEEEDEIRKKRMKSRAKSGRRRKIKDDPTRLEPRRRNLGPEMKSKRQECYIKNNLIYRGRQLTNFDEY